MNDKPNKVAHRGTTPPRQRPRRRPHIDLGDVRSESFGEWLYSHRLGIIAVIVCFIIGGIFIVTARINVEIRPIEYIVEFVDEEPTPEDIEKLKQQRDKLQEDIDPKLERSGCCRIGNS